MQYDAVRATRLSRPTRIIVGSDGRVTRSTMS